MNTPLPHTAYRLPLSITDYKLQVTSYVLCFVLCAFCLLPSASAQRLEVHGIKDFSTNETANKAWGVGGAIDLDQLVKRTIFRIHFDWAMYKPKNDIISTNYRRMTGGVSALYSFKLMEKLTFRCGVEVNYTNARHSYVHGVDTINDRFVTLLQTGNFIGIGPHIALNYEVSSRFNAVLNFVPVYLIPVSSKSYITTVEPEYKKGLWLFPLQLGISYKLFKSD